MAATGAIAALKKRKKRKGKREIEYCPVCKKETEHEQMFKGMFRTNVEYCKECRVMRRGASLPNV